MVTVLLTARHDFDETSNSVQFYCAFNKYLSGFPAGRRICLFECSNDLVNVSLTANLPVLLAARHDFDRISDSEKKSCLLERCWDRFHVRRPDCLSECSFGLVTVAVH